ncbi:PAAR domain-containing protein [Pseudaestuariivita rosea]|uniref:PAAR domain-containing protein n=1 Tax=Pseudaestuariivita rosea TaxID=2763263 RepID=UPI001ABAEAA7|nr:PAAR domain-containing protein [Pseudaestuariivita rosea]
MKPVARVGDTHACPKCGTNTIIQGGRAQVDGRPIARLGDACACGATIIEGAGNGADDGKPIAYLGCKTSHGGTITTGSPTHKVKP